MPLPAWLLPVQLYFLEFGFVLQVLLLVLEMVFILLALDGVGSVCIFLVGLLLRAKVQMVGCSTASASRQRGKRGGGAVRADVPGGCVRCWELWRVWRRWLACK